MLETVYSYIQFIKNEKKLLDEQRSKVQEEAGVEDDGIDSIGSNRSEENWIADKILSTKILGVKVFFGDKICLLSLIIIVNRRCYYNNNLF